MKKQSRHLKNLGQLLGLKGELLLEVYGHLKRIERDGHRLAERYCNGEGVDSTNIEEIESRLKKNLLSVLRYAKSEVVREIQFNWDPRGYFLKLNNEWVRKNKIQIETDWGGYGILCPSEEEL